MMVSHGDCIRVSLHIPPITLKSDSCLFWSESSLLTTIISRILLACIKYLGKFPCPRCLIPNHQISELGTKNDKKRRERLARVDNEQRRNTVELARKWIYKKGVNVKSKSIKDLLGPKGWTPTRVRSSDFVKHQLIRVVFTSRMHFQRNSPRSVLIFTPCSYPIYFTRLNWVFGRQVSLT
jgi:hypothetical protein